MPMAKILADLIEPPIPKRHEVSLQTKFILKYTEVVQSPNIELLQSRLDTSRQTRTKLRRKAVFFAAFVIFPLGLVVFGLLSSVVLYFERHLSIPYQVGTMKIDLKNVLAFLCLLAVPGTIFLLRSFYRSHVERLKADLPGQGFEEVESVITDILHQLQPGATFLAARDLSKDILPELKDMRRSFDFGRITNFISGTLDHGHFKSMNLQLTKTFGSDANENHDSYAWWLFLEGRGRKAVSPPIALLPKKHLSIFDKTWLHLDEVHLSSAHLISKYFRVHAKTSEYETMSALLPWLPQIEKIGKLGDGYASVLILDQNFHLLSPINFASDNRDWSLNKSAEEILAAANERFQFIHNLISSPP